METDKDLVNVLTSEDIRKNDIFGHAIKHSRLPLCISDPSLPDQPIVFANQAFCDLTGYDHDEVIGRNCRFLQGDDTTRESVEAIREAISAKTVTTVEVINYRKDGARFVNALQLGPVLDDEGEVIFYFGSQMDISSAKEKERELAALRTSELLHRLKNIVNVMSIIIKMTGKSETDPVQSNQKIIERLMALGQAHFDTLVEEDQANLSFHSLARTLMVAYAPLGESQVKMEGERHFLTGASVSPVTLLLHELATNSVKHGSLGSESGRVDLTWSESDEGEFTMVWSEHGGPEVKTPTRKSGSKIVSKLVRAAGGTLAFDWQPSGLVVKLRLPE